MDKPQASRRRTRSPFFRRHVQPVSSTFSYFLTRLFFFWVLDILGVLENKYAVPPESVVLVNGRWTSAKKGNTSEPIYRSGSIIRGEDDEEED